MKHFGASIAPDYHFIFIHGAIAHTGRYLDIIQYLLNAFPESAVSSFDLVGHGKSGGTRAFVSEFDHYSDDLETVYEIVKKRHAYEGKKIILVTHSLGGLVALRWFLRKQQGQDLPYGFVFVTPCIRPKPVMGSFGEKALERVHLLTPKLHLPAIYKGYDLTRDEFKANEFDTDALIPKFVCAEMGYQIVAAGRKVRPLSYYIKTPCLFLLAGDDRVVETPTAELFAHGIDKKYAKVVKYPEARHDLLNDINREFVFEDIKKWIHSLG